jgi:hypothetical protein
MLRAAVASELASAGLGPAAAFDTTDDESDGIEFSLFEVDISPFEPKQFALPQRGCGCQKHQGSLTCRQIVNQHPDFSACQHIRRPSSPGALPNEPDRISIE